MGDGGKLAADGFETLVEHSLPEILPGDVLLFTNDGDLLGKVITMLTESPYSHSAMVTDDMGLVHMGLFGVIDENFEVSSSPLKTEGERYITVMRYFPEQNDMTPIVNKTNELVLSVKGYDITALLAIAGIIIFGKFKKNRRWKNIANFVLLKVAKALHKILRDAIYKDKADDVMMCSQLVVEVFYRCRPSFDLKFENAICQRAFLSGGDEGDIRLFDFVDNANVSMVGEFYSRYLEEGDEHSDEAVYANTSGDMGINLELLAQEMDLALSVKDDDDFTLLEKDKVDFGNIIKFILDCVDKIMSTYNSKIPPESAFITPADLNTCTVNLKEIGSCYLRRVKGMD